jgi:hypothetical protein
MEEDPNSFFDQNSNEEAVTMNTLVDGESTANRLEIDNKA